MTYYGSEGVLQIICKYTFNVKNYSKFGNNQFGSNFGKLDGMDSGTEIANICHCILQLEHI